MPVVSYEVDDTAPLHGSEGSFKHRLGVIRRKAEQDRVTKRNPGRVPVIVERVRGNESISLIDKSKFLVPEDLSLGQLQAVIRKRIKLTEEHAMFLFVNHQTLPATAVLSNVYKSNKDAEDGFLYITYAGENAFGAQAS